VWSHFTTVTQSTTLTNLSRFPRQRHADRIEKVPSVIYYDQAGQLRAIGAEILDPEINARAADERWIKVAWRVRNVGLIIYLFIFGAVSGSSSFSDLRGL
jgi:biotin synthase-related radical SAM superfamily protein